VKKLVAAGDYMVMKDRALDLLVPHQRAALRWIAEALDEPSRSTTSAQRCG